MRGSFSPKLDTTLVLQGGQVAIAPPRDTVRRRGTGTAVSAYSTRAERIMASAYLVLILAWLAFLGFVGVMWLA